MLRISKEKIEETLIEYGMSKGSIRKEDLPIEDLGIPSYNTCMRRGVVLKEINRKISELKHQKLNKRCLECDAPIPFESKENSFCDRSCSASYFNKGKVHSEESRRKRSKSLLRQEKIVTPKRCTICGSFHAFSGDTCSKNCKSQLLSEKLKEAHKEGRHLGNKYRSRNSPSYLERSFKEWIDSNYPELLYEVEKSVSIFIDEKYFKTFYLDFFFPDLDLCIELDGSQHELSKEYDEIRDSLIESHHGIHVYRISHKEYQSKEKIDEVRRILTKAKGIHVKG